MWIDDKHFISVSQRESNEEGLFERHLDLSQKNVSHVVEVQKLQQQQNHQLQELLKQQQQQTLAMALPEPESLCSQVFLLIIRTLYEDLRI